MSLPASSPFQFTADLGICRILNGMWQVSGAHGAIDPARAVEEMFALKTLLDKLGSPHRDCRQHGPALDPKNGRASYLFNSTIAGIEKADVILLVGVNPRKDAAVLNARFRRAWLQRRAKIGVIGANADLTYPYEWLGTAPQTLSEVSRKGNAFGDALRAAQHPMVIVGQAALSHTGAKDILFAAAKLAEASMAGKAASDWNAFNVLHASAAAVGGLDIGFVPGKGGRDVAGMLDGAASGDIKVLYLLGADEFETSGTGDAFVIYQGSHGDRGARIADIVLPGAAYTEKNGTYVNTEGRVQLAERAVFPPGDAREDWAIIRALSEPLGAKLPFDNLHGLRSALYAAYPHLAEIDRLTPSSLSQMLAAKRTVTALSSEPFTGYIEDYYQTNAVARASAVMAELSALNQDDELGATGTHG